MERNVNTAKEQRKEWTAPTLWRMSAGSAEAGAGTIGDGGGPGAARS
jgi:hypothetical protein